MQLVTLSPQNRAGLWVEHIIYADCSQPPAPPREPRLEAGTPAQRRAGSETQSTKTSEHMFLHL